MTFHFLITALVVMAVLLWLAALTSWRSSLRLLRQRELALLSDFRYWRDEWEWEQ